jgi:hypothetical protein
MNPLRGQTVECRVTTGLHNHQLDNRRPPVHGNRSDEVGGENTALASSLIQQNLHPAHRKPLKLRSFFLKLRSFSLKLVPRKRRLVLLRTAKKRLPHSTTATRLPQIEWSCNDGDVLRTSSLWLATQDNFR